MSSERSDLRVRVKRIRNARIKHVGKSGSCMVDQLLSIFKRTRTSGSEGYGQPQSFKETARRTHGASNGRMSEAGDTEEAVVCVYLRAE